MPDAMYVSVGILRRVSGLHFGWLILDHNVVDGKATGFSVMCVFNSVDPNYVVLSFSRDIPTKWVCSRVSCAD